LHRSVIDERMPVVRAVPQVRHGNDPLDKAGAVLVLRLVLAELATESR
jgi:hypothetical protein